MKVMISAGGTGGHIFPGVAVAKAMKEIDPKIEVVFLGSPRGLEKDIVPKLGLRLILLDALSWKDKGVFGKLFTLLNLPVLIFKALFLLRRERVSLIVSLGGYASVAPLIAGWILRIPSTLIEPNAIPGVTTRMLSTFAKRIFTAYPNAIKYFKKEVVDSGIPLRTEILNMARHRGVRRADGKMILLCFGGAQGAVALNSALKDSLSFLAGLEDKIGFMHIVGKLDDPDLLSKIYKERGFEAEVMSWCGDMWRLYDKADILFARSGAVTLAEAAAFGLAMILVPYPFAADDHQRANAEYFAGKNVAVVLEQKKLTGQLLAKTVRELVSKDNLLISMSNAAFGLAKLDADEVVAKKSLELVG